MKNPLLVTIAILALHTSAFADTASTSTSVASPSGSAPGSINAASPPSNGLPTPAQGVATPPISATAPANGVTNTPSDSIFNDPESPDSQNSGSTSTFDNTGPKQGIVSGNTNGNVNNSSSCTGANCQNNP